MRYTVQNLRIRTVRHDDDVAAEWDEPNYEIYNATTGRTLAYVGWLSMMCGGEYAPLAMAGDDADAELFLRGDCTKTVQLVDADEAPTPGGPKRATGARVGIGVGR